MDGYIVAVYFCFYNMYKIVIIAGPTAIGKTEYAIRLAEDLNGEIISADSMQIYKYMDIGSAKPTAEERARAKHWMVDEIDPRDAFNVASYQSLAKSYIKDVHDRGKLPIVCGGTGLYINSLLYDMDFSAPEGDESYRDELIKKYETPEKLFERLTELDPLAAKPEDMNNVKRISRYIERLEKGETRLAQFSEMQKPSKDYEVIFTGLYMDRDRLYERINLRVDKLIERGLAYEVDSLMEMGFTADDVAMKGIGYKELMEGLPLNEAIYNIKINTRHYAKRQIIWLRRYKDTIKFFDTETEGYEALKAYVKSRLEDE